MSKKKNSQNVTHYLITNRAILENDVVFNDGTEEASDNLRFGTVKFKPGQKKYKLDDFSVNLEPETPLSKQEEVYNKGDSYVESNFGSTKIFNQIHEKCLKSDDEDTGHILVFIHGFNCDFERSLSLLARLHNNYVESEDSPIEHIVIFSWPSRNNFLTYRDDARDAVKSGYALARSFEKLKAYLRNLVINKDLNSGNGLCNKNIHLMCHSMGCRVLESMVMELLDRNSHLNSVFTEVILSGADIHYDSLERPKPLFYLIDLCQRIHIYYHNNDKALGISEISKNAFNRLGRWGARNSVALNDDIYQVDITHIDDEETLYDDLVNHFHYISSPTVIGDTLLVLSGENSEIFDIFNATNI